MSKILITGDTHGLLDVGKLEEFFFNNENDYTSQDYLIICGDVAVEGFDPARSAATKQFLKDLPVTVLFVDGNHENHWALGDYPIDEWNGGQVHMIDEDIIHLMRGQIYDIDGMIFLTFGGAASIDKADRTEGLDWFPEENPNSEEYAKAWENIKQHDYYVDYIITHEGPADVVGAMGFDGFEEADPQRAEFQAIADEVGFRHWFFGHYHLDEDVEEYFHCLMNRVIDLADYQ